MAVATWMPGSNAGEIRVLRRLGRGGGSSGSARADPVDPSRGGRGKDPLCSAEDAVHDREPIRFLFPYVLRFREIKLLVLWSLLSLAAVAALGEPRRAALHVALGAAAWI